MMKGQSTQDKEEDVGRVYVQTSKGIFPVSVLKAAERKAESKQLKEERIYLEQHGLMPLPFDPTRLLLLKDNCSYFDACVKRIAKDVVGQGWRLQLREGMKENKTEKEKIEGFLKDSSQGEDETFEQTVERAIIDWGVVGWLGIEVSRDKDSNEVNGLWHVPAHTLRVHHSKEKYCQAKGQRKMWFKRFGYEGSINEKTGEEVKGRSKNPANELVFYKNYYPQSDYYGAPNILSSVGSVMGLIGIRDFNLAFFENYGIPAALIILKGRWDKDAPKQISDFIDVEIKGTDNAHKTMVLRPPKDGKVEYIKLGVEVKEGSFRIYQKNLRDEVLVAYAMPPYRIGIAEMGSLGGSTAPESTKIYVSSVVRPLEQDTGRIITNRIIRDGLKCGSYVFAWNELDLRDMDAEVKRELMLFSVGAMTPNQVRKAHGDDPYPGGDQYYVSSAYIPVGEEPVEKREAAFFAHLEEIKAKVDSALKKEKK